MVGNPPISTMPLATDSGRRPSPYPARSDVLTRRLPLGTFVHARSGDKGGDANIGLWVAHDERADLVPRPRRVAEQGHHARRVRELVPEAADLDVEVFLLPNLGAVNVVIHGLLGDGRGGVDPVRPAGQGARRVGAVAARVDRGRAAVTEQRARGTSVLVARSG